MSDLKKFNQLIVHPNSQSYLTSVLGERKGEFVNNITALVANNRQLQECEPVTLMYASLKATALRLPLDPNLAQAYVIPYKNNKTRTVEAQFQMGWRGFVQLAIRSGQFQTINVTDIREGEIQGYDLISGEMLVRALPGREKLPVEGYMAYFRLTNGFTKSLYMTAGEVEQHAKRYSQTYASKNDYVRSSSKWTTDFDAMARKTVLKLLLSRFAPLSVDMQQAVQADQAVMHSDSSFEYVDNDQQGSGKSTLDLAREAMQRTEETDIVNTETGEVVSDIDMEQPQEAEPQEPSKDDISKTDAKPKKAGKSTKQQDLFTEPS